MMRTAMLQGLHSELSGTPSYNTYGTPTANTAYPNPNSGIYGGYNPAQYPNLQAGQAQRTGQSANSYVSYPNPCTMQSQGQQVVEETTDAVSFKQRPTITANTFKHTPFVLYITGQSNEPIEIFVRSRADGPATKKKLVASGKFSCDKEENLGWKQNLERPIIISYCNAQKS